MMGAGPIAKKACELGLEGSYMRLIKPWIKTSLAPVSGVITKYLLQSGLHSTRTSRDFILLAIGAPHVLRAQETLMNELLLQFPTNVFATKSNQIREVCLAYFKLFWVFHVKDGICNKKVCDNLVKFRWLDIYKRTRIACGKMIQMKYKASGVNWWSHGVDWQLPASLRAQSRTSAPVIQRAEDCYDGC